MTVEERDSLRRLHRGIRIEPTLGCRDRYDITADQSVGVLCLPDLTVEIRPKVPISSVLFLISYWCDAISWSAKHPELGTQPGLVEAMAVMLARIVQHTTRHGLLHGYRSEEEPLRTLRGRLLFDAQIRRRFRMVPPLEVRHDLFAADILENRLLLAALNVVGQIPGSSEATRRQIWRARQLFGGVQEERFPPANLPEIRFSRLNQHYQSAIALARLVLEHASLDLRAGTTKGSAFLIDMNKVFERFVRRALRDALAASVAAFPDHAPPLHLDEDDRVPLKPDLCLLREQRVIWVGDAKYKRLPPGAYQNADLYQLLAYAVALGLPEGTLIYAADHGDRAAEHVVAMSGKRLRVIALDLTTSTDRILHQIAAIAREIRPASLQSAASRAGSQSRRAG